MYLPMFEDVLKDVTFQSIWSNTPVMSQSVVALRYGSPRWYQMYISAWGCISSADELQKAFNNGIERISDREAIVLKMGLLKSGCYLCRHAMELMLKGACLSHGVDYPRKSKRGHSLEHVLNRACDAGLFVSQEIFDFVKSVDQHDKTGEVFRYFEGVREVEPGMKTFGLFDLNSYMLDTNVLLANCKLMYNQIAMAENVKNCGYGSLAEEIYYRILRELEKN